MNQKENNKNSNNNNNSNSNITKGNNKNKITKNMQIMEIIVNYPDTMELLMESGLHCVGCGMSQYETLEEGVMVHGWSKDDLDFLVEELNERINQKENKNNN